MASLHGISLFANDANAKAGAWFTLSGPSEASATADVDGWQVEVRKGASRLVARGGTSTGYESALDEALLQAQRGLDIFAITNRTNNSIADVDQGHGVWWHDGAGIRMRHVAIARLALPAISITAATSGPESARVAVTPPRWDESFRYFRLAQVTDDLFDGYRNLYLALESLLSLIRPRQHSVRNGRNVWEKEGAWLREALRAADALEPLQGHVPSGTNDALEFLFQDLYAGHRNTLFHSKRNSATQPVPVDRTAVEASLRRILHLYLNLVRARLGVTFPRQSWNLPALGPSVTTLLSGVAVCVSDDPSPATNDVANPAGGLVVPLTTSPPRSVGGVQVVEATATSELQAIPNLRRFLLLNAQGQVMASEVFDEGPLLHDGIETLELQFGIQLANAREGRARYGR